MGGVFSKVSLFFVVGALVASLVDGTGWPLVLALVALGLLKGVSGFRSGGGLGGRSAGERPEGHCRTRLCRRRNRRRHRPWRRDGRGQ